MRALPDARRDVLAAVPPLPIVTVDLMEASGLVLAEPVVAPHDVPPFANSAMDGYAVRAEDVRDAPVVLKVTEDLRAGYVASSSLEPGTAIKIMTGAPIPTGADAVVRVEDTSQEDDQVSVGSSVEVGADVLAAGGDVVAGTRVFQQGSVSAQPTWGCWHRSGLRLRLSGAGPGLRSCRPATKSWTRPCRNCSPARSGIRNRVVLNKSLLEFGAEERPRHRADDADARVQRLTRRPIGRMPSSLPGASRWASTTW